MAVNNNCVDNLKAESLALKPTPRYFATVGVAVLSSIALLIIGCLGAAGILPGSTVGWLAIGLTVGGFLLSLAAGQLKDRKITLLMGGVLSLIPIVLGALGVAGILSSTQVSWCVIGSLLAELSFAASITYCGSCGKRETININLLQINTN